MMLPADTYVFDAESPSAKLDIIHPHPTDKLIFLHCILGQFPRRTWSLGEIEEQGTYGIVTENMTT